MSDLERCSGSGDEMGVSEASVCREGNEGRRRRSSAAGAVAGLLALLGAGRF